MPQAVTHILFPILIVAIIRDFYLNNKERKNFPLHYVFIAGLGGVLPDIDIVFSVFLNIFGYQNWWIHKTFTHSLFFPISLFAIAIIFTPLHKKIKVCVRHHVLSLTMIFLMLAIGVSTHIGLDALLGDSAYLLYPFSMHDYGINLVHMLPENFWNLAMPTLDGLLLVIWLCYLELHHKISDFI